VDVFANQGVGNVDPRASCRWGIEQSGWWKKWASEE